MRWSKLFIPTRKQAPANARSKAEALLQRAGFIQADSKGRITWLPLGARVLRKLEYLLRVSLESSHSAEITTFLSPADLAMSIAAQVQSYRDIPPALHWATTDESNRASIDVVSFALGASTSSHTNPQAADLAMLLGRLRTQAFAVGEADGPIIWAAASGDGEERVLISDKGNYSALAENAESAEQPWTFAGTAEVDLETIHTPGVTSVKDVAELLNAPTSSVLKTLVFQTITSGPALNSGINPNWVIAVVRGDQELNVRKLERVARENFSVGLRPLADTPELRERFTVGFVGPDSATRYWDAVLVVDPAAAQDQMWIAGANTADHHVRNFNWFRECGDKLADPKKTVVADIHTVNAGAASPRKDGGVLAEVRARRLMRSEPLARNFPRIVGPSGVAEGLTVEHLRIDLGEIIFSIAENLADEDGLRWPAGIAPYEVVITPVRYEDLAKSAADALHAQLNSNGIGAILDDRDARAGSKFADADLIGVPIRVTIGERTLADGNLEIKLRSQKEAEKIPLNQTAPFIQNALDADS